MSYNTDSDSKLMEKHDRAYYSEKRNIEKELDKRGYIQENGEWYERVDNGSGLSGVLGIGFLLFIILFPILTPIMLVGQFQGIYMILTEAVLDMPDNLPSAFSEDGIKEKLSIIGLFLVIGMGTGLSGIIMQACTFNKIKSVFLTVPIALVAGASSTYFAYYEYNGRTDISLMYLVLFAVVFILCLIVTFKAKTLFKKGIYISIITIIGFILTGYNLISPYLLLLLAGSTILINRKNKSKQ